ncbi:glycoside hydrolase family 15 protein [Actinomadura napierensis]|uniref:GH15-like domain-containing protein n=1 Tax=Actinomadura napierensis TaxID=267854 RepID=A0ABN2ZUT4_9ACTN
MEDDRGDVRAAVVPAPARPVPVRGRPARRRTRRIRRVRRGAAFLVVAALVAVAGANVPEPAAPGWASPGLVGGGGWPFAGVPLDPEDTDGAAYLPDSSAVRLKDGRVELIPSGGDTPLVVAADDPRVAQAVRSDSSWLASGIIPEGPTDSGFRDMAARALLDLRLLTPPNGATLASWFGAWRYSWPRDSAFAAAAFTVTGHPSEARRVLRFLARVQTDQGLWAARYNADGTAVTDGRPPQLDSLGWVLWASWLYRTKAPDAGDLPELWPMVRRAADHLAGSLDAEGLPPPSSDYWERDHGSEQDPRRPTLGVVGPALAGLRAAAALAQSYGQDGEAAQWRAAAHRMSAALDRQFAPYGYPRSPVEDGLMDTSVTFVAPPFAPSDPAVATAVADAERRQALPNGGVLPGEKWSGAPDVAWTPETALFGLSAAAGGRGTEAIARLGWLSAHRTALGALPEKVGPTGRQAGVAPLGWTDSLVLLTLSALRDPLPIPPAS